MTTYDPQAWLPRAAQWIEVAKRDRPSVPKVPERTGPEFEWLPSDETLADLRDESRRLHTARDAHELARRTALHEAAHSWLALLTQMPLAEVSIDKRTGAGHVTPKGVYDAGMLKLLLLAGAAGERLHFPDHGPGCRGDFDDLNDLVDATLDEADRAEVLEHLNQLTEDAVQAGERPIKALAEALLRRGSMDGDEALAILREHAPDPLPEIYCALDEESAADEAPRRMSGGSVIRDYPAFFVTH
jgi:hypothetical protein